MSNLISMLILIWPIIYNTALIVLVILLLANIKGKNSHTAFLASISSLVITTFLTLSTIYINLFFNLKLDTSTTLSTSKLIPIYCLPTIFLIFGLFSTVYQDRHHHKTYQNIRYIALIIETLIIYASVFYIFTK